ncbi:hypothetical protein JTF06_07980 [Desemzia sp. RIT804]|uniref:hypothetical protein n=1 Tax=Desemzia sp. RIT 804 TaxID=2810209 RepID=UPI00194FFB32|nr:hypothetical protein [Desemzia sp. RIT 804]MBM6614828.1 hypothetical protein [Desemzia sp. RIT 804]
MTKVSYKPLIALGVCGMLLAGCSSDSDSESAESSTQIEEPESSESETESSSSQEETSDASEEESESSESELSSELEMDPAVVLLPTYLPENNNASIVTNTENEYTVAYTDEQGNNLAAVSGIIYTDAGTALAEMEEKMNGAVSVTPNEETAVDLGYGITGYGEGAAGNQYFSWEEGNWDFTIHSLTMDEMDAPGIAKKIVDYLEENMLPAPSEKGMVLIDYPQGGETVSVDIMWQKENRVYELSTSQVPLEALEMVVSME